MIITGIRIRQLPIGIKNPSISIESSLKFGVSIRELSILICEFTHWIESSLFLYFDLTHWIWELFHAIRELEKGISALSNYKYIESSPFELESSSIELESAIIEYVSCLINNIESSLNSSVSVKLEFHTSHVQNIVNYLHDIKCLN